MRLAKYLALLSTSALLFSVGAFAKASKDSGSFDLAQRAHVGTVELQPGHYKAEWTGDNGKTQISIVRDGKTVATVQGQVKQLTNAAPYDAVTVRTAADHTQRVVEIQFSKHKEELVIPRTAS
jgi:hypothetical protein